MPSLCTQHAACLHQADCPDFRCPGFPPIDMDSAVLGARFSDGGHAVNGEDAEPLRIDPPIATPEQCAWWATLAQVALVFAGAVCAAVVIVHFGGL